MQTLEKIPINWKPQTPAKLQTKKIRDFFAMNVTGPTDHSAISRRLSLFIRNTLRLTVVDISTRYNYVRRSNDKSLDG